MANHDTLHISLFGNLTVSTPSSEPVEIPASRAGALLALLAIEISSNRAFPREEIVDQLWPEDASEDARHKLRQTLYDVRRLLAGQRLAPDAVLIATRSSLQLNPDCVRVDSAMFEAELRAAAQALNPPIRAEHLARAVELYKGELLPGFYQDRFIAEKTRLEEAYHGALQSIALAYEETGQYDRGIHVLRRLLSLNPVSEEAHFALMRLYAATGQPSLVLRQYQNLERTLRDELGEAPSQSAQRVMESLRETALARTTERVVVTPISLGQSVSAEQIDSEDPASHVAPAEVIAAASDQRAQAESRKLPREKRRWSAAVLPLTALCVMMFTLALANRHNTVPKLTPTHPQPPPLMASHAAVLARYKLAADERGSEPTAITTDFAGNILVAGFVETTRTDADFITIKYDPKGNMLWSQRYDGTGHDVDRLRCIATDEIGNVYVSGESDNGKGNGSTRLSGLDVVTIKYSPNGDQLWEDRFNDKDNGEDTPVKMLVESTGNAYVLSACRRLRNGKDAGCDFVLIKYSPLGKRLWLQRYDGEAHGDDVPTGMALLYKDSGVCVCGYSSAVYKTGPEYDYVTIKYSSDGKCLWSQRYGAGNQTDNFARAVSADQDGSVFVVGEAHGLPGTPDESRTGCIMVKYTPSGELQWARGTVKESDRLPKVTASAFWSDGYLAAAGPAANKSGSTVYRVVLRDEKGGVVRTFDTACSYHPLANAPCALVVNPADTLHDAVWMISSRRYRAESQVELFVELASSIDGMRWGLGFSTANALNFARAAAIGPKGIVVAGLCTDRSGIGGITLIQYTN